METLEIVKLWLQLLDHASLKDLPDGDYMYLADRFTMWMGRLMEPDLHRWYRDSR